MAAKWPTSAATDADLSVAVNSLQTTLSAGINSAVTSIPLVSTSGFPAAGYVTIDNEVVSYTAVAGGNLTGAVRGADGTSAAAHLAAAPVSATIVAAHHNSLKDEVKALETDLFNALGAITPSAAGSTATSIYNRFQHLTNQIKDGFGLANWYSTISTSLTAYLLKAGGTMSGAIAMGTNKITGLGAATTNGDAVRYEQLPAALVAGQVVGTATNDDASAGNIGQEVRSVAGNTAYPTSTQYGDLTSISLTAGDWDVSAAFVANASTVVTDLYCGISITSGNSTTGMVQGDNLMPVALPTGTKDASGFVPQWRLKLAGTTTVYFKYMAVFSSAATAKGRISARRRR